MSQLSKAIERAYSLIGYIKHDRIITDYVKRKKSGKSSVSVFEVVCLRCERRAEIDLSCFKKYPCYCRKQISIEELAINYVYDHARLKMKAKSLKFAMTKKIVKKLIFKECYYCGASPRLPFKIGNREVNRNGIDRINSKKGYEQKNVVTCCYFCNRAKNKFTVEDFHGWVKDLTFYQMNKDFQNSLERIENIEEYEYE